MELLTLKDCDDFSSNFSLPSLVLVLKQSYGGHDLSSKKAMAVKIPGKEPPSSPTGELQFGEGGTLTHLLFSLALWPPAT